jgi:shikimate dehydrogenase
MANLAIHRRGLDLAMVAMHVAAADLPHAINGFRAWNNFRGAIVTMPHKSAVVPLLDEASREVREAGACNVIRREADGRLLGTLLDGEAFAASVIARGYAVVGRRVLLAGAGGAASAIAFSLARHGANRITIMNRTVQKAAQLAERVQAAFLNCECATSMNPTDGYDLVVNATSLGMNAADELPVPTSVLRPGTLVADIVISRDPTALLQQAEQSGCDVHDGRQMIAAQIDWMLDFMLR